jgi:hypothetical protein
MVQMQPATDRMAAPLRKWCETAAAGDRRTAILRPRANTDLASASREIEAHDGEVQSAGAGAITVVASPSTLLALARLDWVQAIEEPRRLFTRSSFR